jgi:hypothetical protein
MMKTCEILVNGKVVCKAALPEAGRIALMVSGESRASMFEYKARVSGIDATTTERLIWPILSFAEGDVISMRILDVERLGYEADTPERFPVIENSEIRPLAVLHSNVAKKSPSASAKGQRKSVATRKGRSPRARSAKPNS